LTAFTGVDSQNLLDVMVSVQFILAIGEGKEIMKKAILQLETLACPTCMQKIAGAIANVDGVEKTSVKVLFNASKAKVNFDPEKTNLDTITQAVKNIGYDVLKASAK
jgi:copper chaperone